MKSELCREIRSVLWQKLFIFPVSLLLCGTGLLCCLVPFVPALHTTGRSGRIIPLSPLDVILAFALGLFLFMLGFCLWWTVAQYSVRADTEGITQTNGFFKQSVRWADVASYYMEPNRRYHRERRLHVESVLFDFEGEVIFRGFAHLLVSTRKIIEQRRELWQFVETRLDGKKVEAPSPDLDPEVLALRSLDVDWSRKSLPWKIARIIGLVCYALFWLSLSMAPIYYLVSRNIVIPRHWGTLLILPMFLGPLLPHIIWLKIKKRKIAKGLATRNAAKSHGGTTT